MKYYTLLIFLSFIRFSCGQDIPEKFSNYDSEITVTHSKDTIYAEIYSGTKPNRKKYIWNYKTSVESKKELKIIEFGGYYKVNGNWNSKTIYDRPFNNSEFSKWYSCKDGILKQGKIYTDDNNWATSDVLDGKTKTGIWYYIGIDSKGKKYIGYKSYILISKLKKD